MNHASVRSAAPPCILLRRLSLCFCAYAVALWTPVWGQQPAPPAVEVSVLDIQPQETPAVFEYTGRTESSREVEIRARVSGYLDRIAYQEGAIVRQGDLLFQLDKRPFVAALEKAKGQLAVEQAKSENAVANYRRVEPLARQNAVSLRDLDDAKALLLASKAAVQAAAAQVQEAEINLGYTTIRAPSGGLINRAQVKEGSLVSVGSTLLATIYQLDPIWVNFGVGENDVLKLREQMASGALRSPGVKNATVEVVLADGSTYPNKGRIDYVAPSVDQTTGTFNLRAAVPNPKGELRPGQFVRVRLQGAVRPNQIMVPQRAVLQGANSKFVFVVGPDNKAEVRNVKVGDWYGDQWVITSGLSPGDKVVVDGAGKAQPGAPLTIKPGQPAGS